MFFGFGRWLVADGFELVTMVEPVDPFRCGVFDSFEVATRPTPMDHLRHVVGDNRLGKSVVVQLQRYRTTARSRLG